MKIIKLKLIYKYNFRRVCDKSSFYIFECSGYQTNSQAGFDATTQQNYFQQIPTNYNLQQPPNNFQQPFANNINSTSFQNNANTTNCPMLCLMMPNGMQIPFPIMMPVFFLYY